MKPVLPADSPVSSARPTDNPLAATVVAGNAANRFSQQDFSGVELGDFRLLRRVGEGGMGQVYLAEQRSLQRRVALKIVRPEFSTNPTWLTRFKNEAKAVAQLAHPNIVQVYAVGVHDELQYMALEYVEGMNLKDYLNRKGPPELPIALAIMKQIAAALIKASELGIIHRDIKPENILVTRKADVKITDFGLSRIVGEDLHLTQTGTTIGTPLYMSPEQVMGQPLDPRSDLYSFGATCYHLLAGQPPFLAETALALGIKHISDAVQPLVELRPDLPRELCTLVQRLLAKKPEDRPQTAREVWREIRRIQASLNGKMTREATATLQQEEETEPLDIDVAATTSAPLVATIIDRPTLRRWLWPVMGTSVGIAVVGGSLIGLWLRSEGGTHALVATSRSTPASSSPTGTAASGSPNSVKNPRNPAFQELEKTLMQRIEETKTPRDPGKLVELPGEKMIQGLRTRAELMRMYVLDLDEDNIAKARQFAEREISSPIEPYKALGYIGKAGILANEGKYKESYEALERGYQVLHNSPRKKQNVNQILRMKDIQDIIAVTLKLNQKQAVIPSSLKEIMQEERNPPTTPK